MRYAGEFIGTMVFVMFGCGANCQVGLTQDPAIAEVSAGVGALSPICRIMQLTTSHASELDIAIAWVGSRACSRVVDIWGRTPQPSGKYLRQVLKAF